MTTFGQTSLRDLFAFRSGDDGDGAGPQDTPDPGPAAGEMVPAPEDEAAAPDEDAPAGDAGASLPGVQMSIGDQARETFWYAALSAWKRLTELRRHPGGFIHGLENARGRSVQGQRDYAAQRPWVPAGHEGGITDHAGRFYQKWFAIPGTAAGQAWLHLVQSGYAWVCFWIVFMITIVPFTLLALSVLGVL